MDRDVVPIHGGSWQKEGVFDLLHELKELRRDSQIGLDALETDGVEVGIKLSKIPEVASEQAISLDGKERVLRGRYEGLHVRVVKNYDQEKESIERPALEGDHRVLALPESVTADTKVSELSPYAKEATGAMENCIAENKADLILKKEKVIATKRAYSKFIEDHGITNENTRHLKEKFKKNPATAWRILVAMVVLESVLNGLAFMDAGGSALTSWAFAILISLVNVVFFGWCIWQCMRYIKCASRHQPGGSRPLLIVFAVLAVLANLATAHYRDALPETFPEEGERCYRELPTPEGVPGDYAKTDPNAEAWCLLYSRVVILHGFTSYVFFLLGILFIVIAVHKWEDLYPGYPGHRHVYEEWQQTIVIRKSVSDDTKSGLKKYRNAAAHKLSHGVMDAWNRGKDCTSNLFASHGKLKENSAIVHNECRHAIRVWRDAKKRGWGDKNPEPYPPEWDEDWEEEWSIPDYVPNKIGDYMLISKKDAERIQEKDREQIPYLDEQYRRFIEIVEIYTGLANKKDDEA